MTTEPFFNSGNFRVDEIPWVFTLFEIEKLK